jgi:hypothetical protein
VSVFSFLRNAGNDFDIGILSRNINDYDESFFNHDIKLTENQKDLCEGNLTFKECAESLKKFFFFSDWLMLKKSSPLKQLGQMEPNLAGSIYVRCPNLA